ncbi:hypothetical protein SAMN05216553_104492 [Lentzea fradiae]|uniref:Uncharacterized protein n=1 Tax=Lentzea fradiae TaxID=200378 RepID=A0A1G7QK67_9PSEU|nr:hypothetical protein SAMN05216553_104492 [Lentzea fradiae]
MTKCVLGSQPGDVREFSPDGPDKTADWEVVMFEWIGLVPEPRRDYPCPRPERCTCVWTQLTWGWKKGADRQGCPVHKREAHMRELDYRGETSRPTTTRGRGGAGTGPTSGHGKSGAEKNPTGKNPGPPSLPPNPTHPATNEQGTATKPRCPASLRCTWRVGRGSSQLPAGTATRPRTPWRVLFVIPFSMASKPIGRNRTGLAGYPSFEALRSARTSLTSLRNSATSPAS